VENVEVGVRRRGWMSGDRVNRVEDERDLWTWHDQRRGWVF